MCVDISLVSSYQVRRSYSLLMGNRACVVVHGVGTVNLNLTSEKTIHHASSIRKTN